MSFGINLGIGGAKGAYPGSSPSTGNEVFASPITPDMATASVPPTAHPATWIILGAFGVMVIIYAHWRVY